ncbi:MAG: YSC84-related protein [Phycisphaerae bacterium]|nr:YSC84-related protein [Phycisphaerae bacterium]
MKITLISILGLFTILVFVSGCGPDKSLSIVERQKLIGDMETETLQKLYAQDSAAQAKVEKAVGYGVFANGNVNVIFASVGGGYGVVVNNATGQRTYMKMGLGGLGLGIGAKDYRQVFIFKSDNVLNQFVTSGWEFGGHADAAAKAGESGGALEAEGAIGTDIEVYSMTESGLALQATVTGAKYWKDADLN